MSDEIEAQIRARLLPDTTDAPAEKESAKKSGAAEKASDKKSGATEEADVAVQA